MDNQGPDLLQIDETIGSQNKPGTGLEIRFKIGKYQITSEKKLQEAAAPATAAVTAVHYIQQHQ